MTYLASQRSLVHLTPRGGRGTDRCEGCGYVLSKLSRCPMHPDGMRVAWPQSMKVAMWLVDKYQSFHGTPLLSIATAVQAQDLTGTTRDDIVFAVMLWQKWDMKPSAAPGPRSGKPLYG